MLHTLINARSQATFKGSSKTASMVIKQTKRDNDSTSKPGTKYKQSKDRSNYIHKIQESIKIIPDTETRALSHSKRMKISVPKNR